MTQAFTAEQAVRWTGGALTQGAPTTVFHGVSIDTRTLTAGDLFVAIAGPRHDAHRFLDAATAAGATGLVVERGRTLPSLPGDLPVIETDDTTRALGALAAGHRAGHGGPLVAITGSNGKTTTKEMCASILAVLGACLKNEGNLNNEFGLPLTLLRRDAEHVNAVVELGMNHRGEIARLAAITRPTVGVITNIGTAHIEHLGSREEIALEKGDLLAALDAQSTAVVNADDALALSQAERTAARVSRFGFGAEADVRAEHVERLEGRYAFELVTPAGRADVEVAGLGETAVANALAAAAAAVAAGASPEDIARGLALYRPVRGRLEPLTRSDGGLLINDTYNANPQSTEVALRILAGLGGSGGRGIAVLGDMGELGDVAVEAHREAGRLAATLGIDAVYALGDRAVLVAEGATAAGMESTSIHVAGDWREITALLRKELGAADRVLVKGSRAMRMERIVEDLVGDGRDAEVSDAGGGR